MVIQVRHPMKIHDFQIHFHRFSCLMPLTLTKLSIALLLWENDSIVGSAFFWHLDEHVKKITKDVGLLKFE